jgi:ankyrin repeat protein
LLANGLEKVRLLLKHGAKSDTADADYVTPLTCADKLNPPHMVKLVIQSSARVDKPDLSGETPLAYAVIDGYIDVCEELLRVNADGDRYSVHNGDQQPPLLSKSRDGE